MFFAPANYRHAAFREGARDMLPMATGIAAWGLVTGVTMVKSGLPVPVAVPPTPSPVIVKGASNRAVAVIVAIAVALTQVVERLVS